MMTTAPWVKESVFGIWFLNTDVWKEHVLTKAINDLQRILGEPEERFSCILDVGCGRGNSFKLLDERFNPERIYGIEIDERLLDGALVLARQCLSQVHVVSGNAEAMPYRDQFFDMVFCHQSFHHIVRSELAMKEFNRVLKPGGALLFAESCKKFITSLPIRLLFKHPMAAQKTADEYLDLICQMGFEVKPEAISKPYLWWSRPDFGILERFGFNVPDRREETLLNVVAVKMI